MKTQFHWLELADTVRIFLQRHGCHQPETDMETFTTSAVALQKNLLALRQQRDHLRAMGNDEQADTLEKVIAGIEATLGQLQGPLKPPTLQ
jgi:hypothetical protein